MSHEPIADAAMIETARSFAASEVAPHVIEWEAQGAPRSLFTAAGQAGLCGMLVPKSMGGSELSFTTLIGVIEALAYVDFAVAFALVVHNNHARAIALNGTAAQRERWLPAMLTGERVGAFLLTEPQSGSDAANVLTTAEQTAHGWRINGEKAWVTNAGHTDLLNVYAQTDPNLGNRGIVSIQVPTDTPGVELDGPYALSGVQAMVTGGFHLTNVEVPADYLLVPPGSGFHSAMAGIDVARTVVGAMCCGILQASIDTAMPRLMSRKAFGGPLVDQQGLTWQIGNVATDLEATRLLTQKAARLLDSGADATLAAAHAKKFAAERAIAGVAACMQTMGADGLRQQYPFTRHLAAAKVAGYIDGTTEIQNLVISRALRKRYAAAVQDG